MKKIVKAMLVSGISLSWQLFAMGLGDLSVQSYLDQPFHAKIALLDVGNTPLNEIKVTLASAEDFERVGMERAFALNLLSFHLERNKYGKPIVAIRSSERITEPYMQLLVDLAWAEGQVYRSYNILLDPPNYKLALVKKQLNTIVQRQSGAESSFSDEHTTHRAEESSTQSSEAPTYGPILSGETVWQVAQRYKTEDVLLQQLILAIVGSNPAAFTEGNLNGLVVGSRLQIPSNQIASKVPASLAKSEVLAHDNAWQTRQPILHALLPPYINSTGPIAENTTALSPLGYPYSFSKIPSVTEIAGARPMSSELLPIFVNTTNQTINKQKNTLISSAEEENKAVIDVSTTAINSMREANATLNEQLHVLQIENKRLQKQSIKHKKNMEQLRHELALMIDKQKNSADGHLNTAWFWILFLLWLGVGIKLSYPWLLLQIAKMKKEERPDSTQTVMAKIIEPVAEINTPIMDIPEPIVDEEIPKQQPEAQEPDDIIETPESELEFVPLPDKPMEPIQAIDTVVVSKEEPKKPVLEDNMIEFDMTIPIAEESSENQTPTDEVAQPVKSRAALETLLSLAKTYMTMDDVESAIESLQEVVEFGNDTQKAEAERLLNQLQGK